MAHEGISVNSNYGNDYILGNYSSGGNYSNSVTFGKAPSSPKLGNVTTKVVRLKAGYVGQVLVDDVIVHELKPRKVFAKAHFAAQTHVARRLAKVLS